MNTTHYKSNRKIKKLPVFNDEKDLLSFLERSLTDNLKQFIKVSISTLIKTEMEQIRDEIRQSGNQVPSFNGSYSRQLVSPFGKVSDIPIPRFREGFGSDGALAPSTLASFEDEKSRTWNLLKDMHLLGISQRKVKQLANKHLGLKISPKSIKNAMHDMVMHESMQINNKVLSDDYEYLYMDGIWEKIKGGGWDDTKAVVLCVLGVRSDGTREMIGFNLARAESKEAWTELLTNIKARGLTGDRLNMITMDDSAGAKIAIDKVYPRTPVQNCLVHKLRSVMMKTSRTNRASVVEDLKAITNSTSPDESTKVARAIVKKWYTTEEKAMNSLKHNFEYCLTYFQFPKDKWKQIRSTNILEREFREVRRRTKINDHSFNDFNSARRYHEGIFQYLNQHYPAK